MSTKQRDDIRLRMRRLRRAVESRDRASAAAKLCDRLGMDRFFQSARHIAAYFPSDGEIDTEPVIRHAWDTKKSVYLPVILEDRTLSFAPLTAATQLTENRYGIPEPRDKDDLISTADLDLVLMPLVAFDDRLYRLGMGGGYYDRTFDFVTDSANVKPRLVGVAFDFQRVDTVYPEAWDVPAANIVTDKSMYKSIDKSIDKSVNRRAQKE